MNMVRQGDVLLVAVDEQPPVGTQIKDQVILAEGEMTGHAHRLSGTILEWSVDGQRYVRVERGVGYLSHEDHDATPAGVLPAETTYKVIPQREYNLEGQWRRVID